MRGGARGRGRAANGRASGAPRVGSPLVGTHTLARDAVPAVHMPDFASDAAIGLE